MIRDAVRAEARTCAGRRLESGLTMLIARERDRDVTEGLDHREGILATIPKHAPPCSECSTNRQVGNDGNVAEHRFSLVRSRCRRNERSTVVSHV